MENYQIELDAALADYCAELVFADPAAFAMHPALKEQEMGLEAETCH